MNKYSNQNDLNRVGFKISRSGTTVYKNEYYLDCVNNQVVTKTVPLEIKFTYINYGLPSIGDYVLNNGTLIEYTEEIPYKPFHRYKKKSGED